MSLKNFKTNTKAVNGGVWFTLTTNSDGTVCRFKLRRSGRINRKWQIISRKYTEGVDTETISPEEDARLMSSIFAEACIVEWEHLQPNDDGVETVYSMDNSIDLLSDPAWYDLWRELEAKASPPANFRDGRETEAGN